jgi:guanosine-3',5'-bis(diphosphate) 3'-pyrophosphohydrolase
MTEEQESNELAGLLLKAVHFASIKHSAQRRKGKDHSPYINHPIRVAVTLWDRGGVREQDVLLAALLHDTLEDTQTSYQELAREFGVPVANIVREVSDDKSKPKSVRKALQIEHAPHLSREAKLVKLGDKICNVEDIIGDPPDDWPASRRSEYLDWAEKVVRGLKGVHPTLENAFMEILRKGQAEVMIGGL